MVMASQTLSDFLAAKLKGYQRSDLNSVIPQNRLTQIAVRIGADWESCAHFLGIPQDDIDDIIEEKNQVRMRRIAMLHRWKQLKGKEATYLSLIESLAQMGRRDLIEFILSLEIKREAEENVDVLKESSREIRHFLLLVLTSCLQIGKSA